MGRVGRRVAAGLAWLVSPRWRWLLPGFALFTLLRLPSFMEPHWYADEASYTAVATSLLHGHVLYLDIWNNKPPLQSWTIAGVVAIFGPNETGLHLLTFVSGLATLAAVGYAGIRLLGRRRAAVALVVMAVVLGLPVLDAELALPESLLIAPAAWAGAILVTRLDPRAAMGRPRRVALWPIAVGALVAAGVAYQQTVLAEAAAFGLAMALSPRARWRDVAAYTATVALITGAWLTAAILQAGAGRVWFAMVGFYIPYTQSVLPSGGSGVALHLAGIAAAVALVALGAFLCRRMPTSMWAVWLWAGASLSVAALARQPYAHYLTAAAAPVALLFTGLPVPRRARMPNPAGLVRAVPLVAGVLLTGFAARVAGLDWIPQAAPSPSINGSRTLQQYYGGAVATVVQGQARADWDDSFDWRVAADRTVAAWVGKQGLAGATAVVWSSEVWLYSLAKLPVLVPTPPIYNDEVLLGGDSQVATLVEGLKPTLIIVADDAAQNWPSISRLLDGVTYQRVLAVAPESVWMRAGAPVPQVTSVSAPGGAGAAVAAAAR
jgi:4-amino-4-deoxy-L-arabinose transferase-like glycosyltransferase